MRRAIEHLLRDAGQFHRTRERLIPDEIDLGALDIATSATISRKAVNPGVRVAAGLGATWCCLQCRCCRAERVNSSADRLLVVVKGGEKGDAGSFVVDRSHWAVWI